MINGSTLLKQVERWVAETDVALAATRPTAADARAAACEAMDRVVALGCLTAASGQADRASSHRTVVALYQACHRWLETATNRTSDEPRWGRCTAATAS